MGDQVGLALPESPCRPPPHHSCISASVDGCFCCPLGHRVPRDAPHLPAPPLHPLVPPRAPSRVTDGSAAEPLSWPVLVPASQTHLLIRALSHLRTMSPSEIILFRHWSAPGRPETPLVGSSVPPAAGSTLGPAPRAAPPSWAVLNR